MGEYYFHLDQLTVGYDGKPLIEKIQVGRDGQPSGTAPFDAA